MLNIADKKFEEIGFNKTDEEQVSVNNNRGMFVGYERENKEFGFIHRLTISVKSSGDCLIHSYVKSVNSEGFNNVVGLTAYEMKLALRKMKEIGLKIKR